MTILTEGAELKGESGKTYLAVSPLGQANVWTAVDKDDYNTIVVLKAPGSDDTGQSWPNFQHEMVMHELFKDATSVRKQVDRIPPVDGNNPPTLVLEIFDGTLWQARTKRPFSKAEIKTIARSILHGLQEVHDNGLVFAGLKMQNVMLNGFSGSDSANKDGKKLDAKLGDLGIVMEPAKGKVQPVAYRAPEVFFKADITQAADIWAFGLLYCHLLEAQHRFSKTGLYDDLYTGGGTMPEREQAVRHAMANDYDIANVDYYKGTATPYRDHDHATGQQWDELRRRGLSGDDVEFLQWILKPDPRERPTAKEVLESRWLAEDDETNANGKRPHPPARPSEGLVEPSSAARPRRDADSQRPAAPNSITIPSPRPETLLRGVSQATYTPGIASDSPPFTPSGGNHAFDTLLKRKDEPASPVKSHPLVTSALSASETTNEPTTKADHSEKQAVNGTEKLEGAQNAQEKPVPGLDGASNGAQYAGRSAPTGDTYLSYRASASSPPQQTSELPKKTENIIEKQPAAQGLQGSVPGVGAAANGVGHIGKNASSGGTYLSYR